MDLAKLNELNKLMFDVKESLMNVTWNDDETPITDDEYLAQLIKDSTELINFLDKMRDEEAQKIGAFFDSSIGDGKFVIIG